MLDDDDNTSQTQTTQNRPPGPAPGAERRADRPGRRKHPGQLDRQKR